MSRHGSLTTIINKQKIDRRRVSHLSVLWLRERLEQWSVPYVTEITNIGRLVKIVKRKIFLYDNCRSLYSSGGRDCVFIETYITGSRLRSQSSLSRLELIKWQGRPRLLWSQVADNLLNRYIWSLTPKSLAKTNFSKKEKLNDFLLINYFLHLHSSDYFFYIFSLSTSTSTAWDTNEKRTFMPNENEYFHNWVDQFFC